MIANAKRMRQSAASARAAKFLALLPQIREQARFAFRGEGGERREELIAETIANCWVAFVRLAERGLIDAVYATPLTQYAIKQVRDGRRVGGKLNVRDVTSEYAQQAKRFTVERSGSLRRRGGRVARGPDRRSQSRTGGHRGGTNGHRRLVRQPAPLRASHREDVGQQRDDQGHGTQVRRQSRPHLADSA